jgi:hypothetical protein
MLHEAIDGIASIVPFAKETVIQALEIFIVTIIGFVFLVALLSGQT